MTDTTGGFQSPRQQGDPFAGSGALLAQLGGASNQNAALLAGLGQQLRAGQAQEQQRQQQVVAGQLAPLIAQATTTTSRSPIFESPKYSAIFARQGGLNPDGTPSAQARADLRQALVADGWAEGPALDLTVESAMTPVPYTYIEESAMASLAQRALSAGMSPGQFSNLMDIISPNTQVGIEGVVQANRKAAQQTFGSFEPPRQSLQDQVARSLSDVARGTFPGGATQPGALPAAPTAAPAGGPSGSSPVMPTPTGKFIMGPDLFKVMDVDPILVDSSVSKVLAENIPGATMSEFIEGKGTAGLLWRQLDGMLTWNADTTRFEVDAGKLTTATSAQRQALQAIKPVLEQMLPFLGVEWAVQLKGASRGGAIKPTKKQMRDIGLGFGVALPNTFSRHVSEQLDAEGMNEDEFLNSVGADMLFEIPAFMRSIGADDMGIVTPTGLEPEPDQNQ